MANNTNRGWELLNSPKDTGSKTSGDLQNRGSQLMGFTQPSTIAPAQAPAQAQPEKNVLQKVQDFIGNLISPKTTPAPQEPLTAPGTGTNNIQNSGIKINLDEKGDVKMPDNLIPKALGSETIKAGKGTDAWSKVREFLDRPLKDIVTGKSVEESQKIKNAKSSISVEVQKLVADKYKVNPKDVDLGVVESNLDAYTKDLGIRTQLNDAEFAGVMMALSAPLAIASVGAVPVLTSFGKFTAYSTAFDAVASVLTGKPMGEGLKSFLPEGTPTAIKDLTGALDLMGKAYFTHKMSSVEPKIGEFLTKQKLVQYNLPTTVTLDAKQVSSVFQTGEGISAENMKLLQSLGLTSEEWRLAVKNGIKIDVPTEKIITITDRPYWAKIKSFVGLPENAPKVFTDLAGKPKQGVAGLLKEGNKVDVIEKQAGWAGGDAQKAKFDMALLTKDAKTVQQMLPEVPDYYKQKFATEISKIVDTTAKETPKVAPTQQLEKPTTSPVIENKAVEKPTVPASKPVTELPKADTISRKVIIPDSLPQEVTGKSITIRPDGTASFNLEVSQEARGKGIGAQAVKAIEATIVKNGATKIQLPVKEESVGFFEKQGYKVTGDVKNGIIPMEKTLEAPAKKVIKPNTMKPIGTGETKVSTLGVGVEQKAVEKKLIESLSDLPEYKEMKFGEQSNKAVDMLIKDPERAKRIALGQEKSPAGLIPEAVFTAVENKAIADGSVDLINQLAHSTLVGEATAMGQRISYLQNRNPDSPVSKIKELMEARKQALEEKLKKPYEKAIKDTVKQIQDKIVKPSKNDWNKFIESIEC